MKDVFNSKIVKSKILVYSFSFNSNVQRRFIFAYNLNGLSL